MQIEVSLPRVVRMTVQAAILVLAFIGAYAIGYRNGADDMARLIFGPPAVIQPQAKPEQPERSAYWRSEDEQPVRTIRN